MFTTSSFQVLKTIRSKKHNDLLGSSSNNLLKNLHKTIKKKKKYGQTKSNSFHLFSFVFIQKSFHFPLHPYLPNLQCIAHYKLFPTLFSSYTRGRRESYCGNEQYSLSEVNPGDRFVDIGERIWI